MDAPVFVSTLLRRNLAQSCSQRGAIRSPVAAPVKRSRDVQQPTRARQSKAVLRLEHLGGLALRLWATIFG